MASSSSSSSCPSSSTTSAHPRKPTAAPPLIRTPGLRYLVLGGAGLVGRQVCRQLMTQAAPSLLVVSALHAEKAEAAVAALHHEFATTTTTTTTTEPATTTAPLTHLVAVHGNIFVPATLAQMTRDELVADADARRQLLDMLYGRFEDGYRESFLGQLLLQHRPDVVVDCVNAATGLSYQNVFDGARKVREWIAPAPAAAYNAAGLPELEQLLMSQSVPQLVHHVRTLHTVAREIGLQTYLKVGTVGTGGMGMNIPYTHSEESPSPVLLAKTESAFGHTGLLFLAARTPDGPRIKEIKPAGMIGFRSIRKTTVRSKHGDRTLYEPRAVTLAPGGGDDALQLRLSEDRSAYTQLGPMEMVVVDTGENGVFAAGEFEAITDHDQMEFLTPEEIARIVLLELAGVNTGHDVIAAVNAAVLDPSYKAGLIRQQCLAALAEAEGQADSGLPSVALGLLGPPELSKLLFEAQLFKECFGTFAQALRDPASGQPRAAEAVAQQLLQHLEGGSAVRRLAPSVGIPILTPDGTTLIRGPDINIPQKSGHAESVQLAPEKLEEWANKGWVDLRPPNVARWLARLETCWRQKAADRIAVDGSAVLEVDAYLPPDLSIGSVASWILTSERGGNRMW